MDSCKNIMCKYNLNNKSDMKKWLLKNHPDKGGKIPKDEFNKVIECYQSENYCNIANKNQDIKNKPLKVTKKNRRKIFTCMRKTANFSKINNYHKFDKTIFNPTKFNEELINTSPKITQLLNNIKQLDDYDEKNHGRKFKHFIFSDVKEGGYGAKIIASALISNGYNNVIKARKVPKQQKLKLYVDLQTSNYKNFALLSSNTIYGSTFNEKLKKEILGLFNQRPNNIYGKNIRLIIFDSGFKEGIDLFDIKYIHIFEPSMTIADLKQTVGRGTRTCGQKGLEFQDNIGWPLYVYNYYLTVPEILQDSLYAKKFLLENITKPTQNEINDDILLFKNVEKFNDTTMNYSEFDKVMNTLSEQLYKLAPLFAVDYMLTKNLHNVSDLNHEFMEKDLYLTGGANNKDPIKNVNKSSKYFEINNIQCMGNCGKKTTKDVPISIDFMKKVYKKYNHPNKFIPKTNLREFFCNFMKNLDNNYCKHLNYEWSLRYTEIPQIIENNKNKDNIKKKLENLELLIDNKDEDKKDPTNKKYDIVLYKGTTTSNSKTLSNSNNSNSKSNSKYNIKSNNYKLNFLKMRDYIKNNYNNKDFVWEPLVIENKCIPKPGDKPKEAHEITLNPTQKFITNYFTPQSPYKGLLLWHSVGTGKTCTGVAVATSSFEKENYTILWVTRTTLKSDVWKNIFDQICHAVLLEEVKKGLLLPEKINDRKKLLSDRWLEPMSYKQFSNLLLGKNKTYEVLLERNGKNDLLKKTLIIIDEAHKLYGGDLKATERPDTNIMEKLIMNSYKKSGNNSCKLLIMTATPFTNSPLELFSLTNLFMTNESEKITTNKEEFIKQYMTSDNILSENGVKNIANKLSGYISYLNREKDATQFAQPIMINVPVIMSHIEGNKLRDAVYLNKVINTMASDTEKTINAMKEKIKIMKADYKMKKQLFNETKATMNKQELKELNDDLKRIMQGIKNMESELEKLKDNKDETKENIKDLKERVREIKRSLIQEYMMFKKCLHLTYKSPNNVNKTKKNNFIRKVKSEGYKSNKSVSKKLAKSY